MRKISLDLFELLQGAQIGGMWLPRVDLWPRSPGNLTNIDVAMSVDCETMRGQELAELGPGRGVAEAAGQLAFLVDNTDPWSEIRDVAADGGGWADFADVADRLVTVWHVEAAR